MTDDRKHERREDPDPAEIEVDEANELFGGPSTESLEAGLSSPPQQDDASQARLEDSDARNAGDEAGSRAGSGTERDSDRHG